MEIQKIISQMSLEEKISFCTGADFWQTKPLGRLGIPSIMMSDGPHGLRCQKGAADMVGVNKSLHGALFTTAGPEGAAGTPELGAAWCAAFG